MKSILLASLISLTSLFLKDTEIAGVNYAATYKIGDKTLQLNGAGARSKWFIDLYTAGLYLPKKSTNAEEIINCECLQALRLVIVSSLITTDKFNAAIDEAFNKSMQNNTSPIEAELAQFKKSLGTGLKSGDEFLLVHQPNEGMKVYKNKKYCDTIKGEKFKQETVKIWLGKHAINTELKNKLLGKSN